MRCPKCNDRMLVKDTVTVNQTMYRQRKCRNCGEVVYTTEQILTSSKWDFSNKRYEYQQKSKKKNKM